MDNKSNKYGQYLPFANDSGEPCSNTPGDFINSEDLKQHLPRAMEMIHQAGSPGMNLLPGRIPSPQDSASMPQSMNMQNKIPGEITTGSNIGARMPEKEVLMEPCAVSQPMNASLRKAYSKGGFYFLKQ